MFVALFLSVSMGQQIDPWPLTDRWSQTSEGYFEGLHRDLLLDELGGQSALDLLDYEVTEQQAHLYVPADYTPDGGYGVFVYVDAGNTPELRETWKEELDSRRLIFVAPRRAGNSEPSVVRMALALDALASVENAYAIDPGRRVLGGFSGGGAIAVMMGTAWPDVFVGTLDQCRALMWEEHPIATLPGSMFGAEEIGHMDPDGLSPLRNSHRFAFLSGDRDVIEAGDGTRFSNYEGMLKGMGDWWSRDIRARLFDIPGHDHSAVGSYALGMALDWVLQCKDPGEFPARFDSDHMPPHTPVSTPEVPPPACATLQDETPAKPPGARQGECGCDGASGSAGSWWHLVVVVSGGAIPLVRRSTQARARGATHRACH